MVEDKKVEDSELATAEEQPAIDDKSVAKAAEVKPSESEEKKSGADDKDSPAKDSEAAESDADKSADDDDSEEEAPVRRSSSKHSRYGVVSGVVHVMATFNNTKVTITDRKGNVIAWRSGGRCGFKGSRKSTAYAATIVAQEAAREAASKGLREVEIRLNGPGAGRESAVRAIHAARIKVTAIQDVTPIPHNGCRPPKRRRV